MINKIKLKYRNNINDKDFGEIFKSSILSFIVKILAVCLGFIFSLIISKYYGAEVMGVYTLINTLIGIAIIPSLFGTNTSILRFIPEHVIKYSIYSSFIIYKKIFILVTFISFIVSIITYFSASIIENFIFDKIEMLDLIITSSFFIVLKSIIDLNIGTIRALKSIHVFVLFQILRPVLNVVILLFVTYFYFDLNNPIYAVLYTYIAMFFISVCCVKKIFKDKLVKSEKIVRNINYKKILSTSFPMFLTSVMGLVLTQTDIVMLGIYTSNKEVGVYAVVVKLALLTSLVLSSINTIVAPKFAELYHSKKIDILENIVKKSSKLIFYSTLPIILGLLIFGEYVLSIFGKEFVVGYSALVILTFGQFINSLVGSVGYLMNMTGHQKEFNYIMILSAILNISLNVVLIPIYGINGAAIASVMSLIFWNLTSLIYIKIRLNFYTGYLPIF